MPPQHAAALIDDVAGFAGLRPQPLDDRRVGALRHEADVLAVGLVRHRQIQFARQRAGLVLQQSAEREAQEFKFGLGRAAEEIALIAADIDGPVQFRAVRAGHAADVMPGAV